MIKKRPVSDPEIENDVKEDVELNLDEADRIADESETRYTHDEVFSKIKSWKH